MRLHSLHVHGIRCMLLFHHIKGKCASLNVGLSYLNALSVAGTICSWCWNPVCLLCSWCKGASIGWHSDDNKPNLRHRAFTVRTNLFSPRSSISSVWAFFCYMLNLLFLSIIMTHSAEAINVCVAWILFTMLQSSSGLLCLSVFHLVYYLLFLVLFQRRFATWTIMERTIRVEFCNFRMVILPLLFQLLV